MNNRFLSLSILMMVLLVTACSPAEATPPPVDVIGTRAVELASMMQTATVAAYSPTPPITFTPVLTATATLEPTPVVIEEPKIINGPATCYIKPNPAPDTAFTSNITNGKIVELLAIGATPGWYKIKDPYFNSPCWVAENNLQLDPNMDLSAFPVE